MPPILVLDDDEKDRAAKERWVVVDCKTKNNYGSSKHDGLIAEGLTLCALFAGERLDRSNLFVVGDELVRRSMEQGLLDEAQAHKSMYGSMEDEDPGEWEEYLASLICGVQTSVEITDKNLIVLTATISLGHLRHNYYLVYDAALASMSLISHLSFTRFDLYFGSPLPIRHGSNYTLVLILRDFIVPEVSEEEEEGDVRDVLCLWPPPPSSRPPPRWYPDVAPWHYKEARGFDKIIPERFNIDLSFASNNYAFWADLSRGVLCCRCEDLLTGGYCVDFSLINLPPGCGGDDIGRPHILRTMGCTSGGSIKFVSISVGAVPETENTVKEWALDTATWQWTQSKELRFGDLWELDDIREQGLPVTRLWCPLLSTVEDDSGALYFILSNPCYPSSRSSEESEPSVHYMCRFDMESKRLMSSRLSLSPWIAVPFPLVGCEFFRHLRSQDLRPLVQNKRKRTQENMNDEQPEFVN